MTVRWYPRVAGLLLASLSLVFSATGLVRLFSGAGIGIVALAIAFEVAKVAGTLTLYTASWRRVTTYFLAGAVAILVGISSIGIYGYLGRAFAAGRVSLATNTASLEALDAEIEALTRKEARLLDQLDRIPDAQGSNRRRLLAALEPQLSALGDSLQRRQAERRVLVQSVTREGEEIGDLRYAAEMLGISQEDLARALILVLSLLLDPLAVLLLFISAPRASSPASAAQTRTPREEPVPVPATPEKPRRGRPAAVPVPVELAVSAVPPPKTGRGLSAVLEDALRYVSAPRRADIPENTTP